MGIGSEHKVEESASRRVEIGVEIRTADIVGGMSRDSDKRGA